MRVSCTFVLLAVCFAAQSRCAPLDPLSIIPNVPVAGSLFNGVPSVPGLDTLSGLPVVGSLSSRDLHDITDLDSLKSLPDFGSVTALPAVNNLSSVTGSDGLTPLSILGGSLPVAGDSLPVLQRDLSGLRSALPIPTLPALGGSSPVSGLGGFLPTSALPALPGLGGSSPMSGLSGMLPIPSSGSFPVAGGFLPFKRDLGDLTNGIAGGGNILPKHLILPALNKSSLTKGELPVVPMLGSVAPGLNGVPLPALNKIKGELPAVDNPVLASLAPGLNGVPSLDSISGTTKMVGLDALPALPGNLAKRGLIDLNAPLGAVHGLPIVSSLGKPSELISSIPLTGSALPLTTGLSDVNTLEHLPNIDSARAVPSELLHSDALSHLTGNLGSN